MTYRARSGPSRHRRRRTSISSKATGVLPVRIDVPRAGTSHRFIKPLVVDQETVVRLRFKRR